MPKSTDAEIEQRVNKVYDLLVCSWLRSDIVQYGSKEWGITERQVDDYIAMAKVKIKEIAKQTQEEWMEDAKNKFIDLYKKAMSNKDIAECRRITATANKVLGYEKLNLNISGNLDVANFDIKLNEEEEAAYKERMKGFYSKGDDLIE